MGLVIDLLTENDLDRGNEIFQAAFATFERRDPKTMFGDSDAYRTRWRSKNTRFIAARRDGELVGSNVITRWGSLGTFGPLTVTPDRWDQGIARALMERTEQVFDEWRVTHRALFTFANSPKHIALYQKFGYWPTYLTPMLGRSVGSANAGPEEGSRYSLLSTRSVPEQTSLLSEVRDLCDDLLPGFDATGELESVRDQRAGETVLLLDRARLDGFAVCHIGAGTEACSGEVYVRFGMVRPGSGRNQRLKALVAGVEALGRDRGAPSIQFGCNLSHRETYRTLVAAGYRSDFIGVAMVSGPDLAYLRPEFDVLDDWR
jgi:GNAT superfamily N-acetyltransferase